MKLIKLHLLVAAMIIVTSGCVGSGKKYKQQENSAAGVVDSKNKDCYGTYKTYYKVLDDAVVLSDSTEIFNNSGRLAAQYILKRQ